ncbi:hypothetical protein TYRP_020764 [Tyrophagus putrescentiae]|nr:hypothetical protein TYRP_020764 [Tyrophagus putrescentiae]
MTCHALWTNSKERLVFRLCERILPDEGAQQADQQCGQQQLGQCVQRLSKEQFDDDQKAEQKFGNEGRFAFDFTFQPFSAELVSVVYTSIDYQNFSAPWRENQISWG